MSTIITKNSANSGSTPPSLIQGELAINVTDGRLFYGSGSGNDVKEFGVTASYALQALSASYAETASYAPDYLPLTGGTINGDVTVNGTASIAFLNVSVESASVIYSSGSNQFGDASNDVQTLYGTVDVKTGPVLVTGSLDVSGGITGSLLGTASYATQALSSSYALISTSASYAVNADTSISSSYTLTASYVENAQTASYVNPLYQQILISGSLKLDPTQDPDPSGLDLDSTVLFQSSSNTTLGYDLYVRQNGNLVKWKWVEGNLETGLLYGGVVTYSGSNVFVSPGSGIIVEHNATTGSEVSPMVEYVTWSAITQSITNIATQQVTYLYIDQNGSLQQQSTRFTSQQYHDYIPLGAVGHFDYTQVSAFGGSVQTAYDQISQISNFVDAFGPLKMSGYGLTGQAGSLRLSVGSGTSFIHGGFYQNDPEFPSQITTPSQATASLAHVYRSGSSVIFDTNAGSLYTTVDPTQYDRDGDGTLANVGNGNWSIQRVFTDPKTGVLYVYYGQERYTTLLNALQYLPTDPFTEGDTFDFTTFVGYLVLRGNASDLTDTSNNSIINGGLFRGSGQGSGGGVAISNLDDLTDVSITGPVDGEALIYNSGTWINGYPTSASYALTASYSNTSTSASYANNATTAQTAQTASYVIQAVSASYATQALSASYATTASYVLNAVSASFATLAQTANTASYVVTAQTASYVLNAVSASFASTASYVNTLNQIVRVGNDIELDNQIGAVVANSFDAGLGNVFIDGTSGDVAATSFTAGGGAVQIDGITGEVTATTFIGDLTGTASYATQALSASWAPGGNPFPFTGSAGITGSLTVVGKTQSTQIGAGAAPSGSVPLDVRAQGALSTDIAFRVRNSANSVNLQQFNGDGSWLHRNNANSWYEYFNGSSRIEYRRVGAFELGTNNDVTSFNFSCNTGNVLFRGGSNILNIISGNNYHFEQSTGILSTTGAGCIVMKNRTAPSTNVPDRFYLYSADIVAGNAAPHFRTEAGNIVKLYTQAAVTSSQGIADVLTNLGFLTGSSTIASTNPFPYTGSAVITGSLTITGSVQGNINVISIVSSTASMNLSLGNFFELTLASSTTTYLEPTNIQPGQTINLKINQPATSGSLTYGPKFKFPGGIPYSASSTGSVTDIVSLISFDSTTLYATAIKNLS